MASLNKVQLIGRLGKDPEVRNLENGKSVTNFTIATSETYKDSNGEKKEITDWHNIVIWGKLGSEVVGKYCKKGDQLFVEGKNRTRSWEKDGITRYTTEVLVDNAILLGSKSNGEARQSSATAAQQAPTPSADDFMPTGNASDDLPF